MLEQLKQEVLEANLELVRCGLVTLTWGNVSAIDREKGLVVIKPSGVDYDVMKAEDMCVVDMSGKVVEGMLRPSSDTPTHLQLYRAFPEIGGVTHTHSTYAVAWAQAGEDLPCYGTTHADCFFGTIPCTRPLTDEEINRDYEGSTGVAIAESFLDRGIKPLEVPAVLCRSHGPFTWGKTAQDSVHNAFVLEQVARMALLTRMVHPRPQEAPMNIQKKHYERKHGKNAYYGQK